MNKQENSKTGGRKIEWTDYTWNPVAGCQHACRWRMPDGSIAVCYAETVATKFKQSYPDGFEAHYWHPQRLIEPLKQREPSKIFMDSMSDLLGRRVPAGQIDQVLSVCRKAKRHTFQLLTKNAPRLLKFDFPRNIWVGASSPPDFMWRKRLDKNQQSMMLDKTLKTLARVKIPVRWMSFEPLSWDIAQIVADNKPLQWAVIGAASKGPKVYQPEPDHVARLLEVLDQQGVPVFFKGNLWGNPAIDRWREYFPNFEESRFMDSIQAELKPKIEQLALFS